MYKRIAYIILFLVVLFFMILAWRYYEVQQFEKQKAALLENQKSSTTAPFIDPTLPASTTATTTTDAPVGLVTHIKHDADMFQSVSVVVNQQISSPLQVRGSVRGSWYFEGSFPVELRTLSGQVLAQTGAQAQGDWMTTNFVPFTVAPFSFVVPAGVTQGVLVLKKDNPSGDSVNDDELQVVIGF